MPDPLYVTTPIYYVNDRPHIGHCYTTLVADVMARSGRLLGRDTFFLTGTDEHAEKVVTSAAAHDMSPQAWADLNAGRFLDAFAFMGFSNDDFIRTTEDRHKDRASGYIQALLDRGDIELGDYTGWYDPSQEEYLTETQAKESDFKSPVTGKPLEERTEQNYFFRLDRYEGWLRGAIEGGEVRILPEARKNEVLGRIRQGLNKVPVSRRIKEGDAAWGISMPGDPEHRVYVWIEALCNYLTGVDTPERRRFWAGAGGGGVAPVTHLMAKDILWFHAVIWPAMLHALGEATPHTVYAHAYFVAEGRKMSKSLGNFIEIDELKAYAKRYSLDAVRWYLATQGPLGANDADFAYARFVEVYNADLANGVGNAVSRVSNMIEKYFGGEAPAGGEDTGGLHEAAAAAVDRFGALVSGVTLDEAVRLGIELVGRVDGYINETRPFSLAKQMDEPGVPERLGEILHACAEALRIATLLLSPAMPEKMAQVWRDWNCRHLNEDGSFAAPLAELAAWGGAFGIAPGQKIRKGEALFMRADPKAEPPVSLGSPA